MQTSDPFPQTPAGAPSGPRVSASTTLWGELRGERIWLAVVGLAAAASLLIAGGPIEAFAAVVVTVPTALLLFTVIRRLDRYEPEPRALMWRTVLWGAGAATLVAGIVNDAASSIGGDLLAAGVSAPIGEEALKAAALVYVIRRRPGMLRGVHDGIIYACCVGAGFAVVEDLFYAESAFLDYGVGGFIETAVGRTLTSPLHLIFTACTGLMLGAGVARGARGLRLAAWGGVGYVVAVLMHSFWNLDPTLVFAPLLQYLPLLGFGAALSIGLSRRERLTLQIGLLPELVAGTIDGAQYQWLTATGRTRFRTRRQLRRTPTAPALAAYEQTAFRLADAARRDDTHAIEVARAALRQQRAILLTADAQLFGMQVVCPDGGWEHFAERVRAEQANRRKTNALWAALGSFLLLAPFSVLALLWRNDARRIGGDPQRATLTIALIGAVVSTLVYLALLVAAFSG